MRLRSTAELRRRRGRAATRRRSRRSPRVGRSSAPSRCSSVLLPAPLAPTIATISPALNGRLTPSSTGMTSAVAADVRLRQTSCASRTLIVIRAGSPRRDTAAPPVCAGYIVAIAAIARLASDDQHHVGGLRRHRQVIDEIDLRVELDELVLVERERRRRGRGSARATSRRRRSRAPARRRSAGSIAPASPSPCRMPISLRLVRDDHRQRADDVERRDEHDEQQDHAPCRASPA